MMRARDVDTIVFALSGETWTVTKPEGGFPVDGLFVCAADAAFVCRLDTSDAARGLAQSRMPADQRCVFGAKFNLLAGLEPINNGTLGEGRDPIEDLKEKATWVGIAVAVTTVVFVAVVGTVAFVCWFWRRNIREGKGRTRSDSHPWTSLREDTVVDADDDNDNAKGRD